MSLSFDPKKHIIRIQGGREYLPVAARLVWFRGEHPDWGIVTTPVTIDMERQYAIFSCQIFNAEGKLMSTATKMENIRGFGDFLEKAETGSVGRALAYCGYGTQFAPDLDEGTDRIVDAPAPLPASALPTADAGSSVGSGVGARAGTSSTSGNRCTCGECPNVLTAGQMTMSTNKFGVALCLLHQKNAMPIARPRHAANPNQNGAYANA